MYPENDNAKIKPENLLLVRTDRIGDVILSLPLAGIIKKYYPNCKITFLIREYTKDIVEGHPFIDNILILKEEEGKILLKNNISQIKKFNYDSTVIVYPTFITALIIFLSGIKNRIGTGYRWYSLLFNKKIYEHRKYALKHELEYNVNLLNFFGIYEEITFENVRFNVPVKDKARKKILELFEENNIDLNKPIIIVHPGSGGSAVDLPIQKFKELIEIISERLNAEVILTGSSSEVNLCNELKLNDKIKNFAGLLTLSELIALIEKSGIFIANSTGPLHIAAALGKYTIGFYPHIKACSAKRWGPYTKKRSIFSPSLPCDDCMREQCDKQDCMNTIKVTDIFGEVEEFFNLISR